MAGSIKGIIVEIGGDTSGLQKALKNVNNKIKKGIKSIFFIVTPLNNQSNLKSIFYHNKIGCYVIHN